MLELKQTIINVNSYTAYYDLLFYEKNNIIYLNDKPIDYPELPRIAIDNKLVINKNNVFYSVLKDNIPCIEYNNSKKIAYYLNSLCSFDNSKVIGGIISFDNKLKKIVYDNQGIYDLNKNEIVSKINIDREYSFVFNIDRIAFFQKEKFSIVAYSLTTPQTPQWQFDLSQLGTFYSEQSQQQEAYKVEKFIGIHQKRLYVALNGGMLLEIDIATGAVTYQWELNKQTRLCSGKQAGIYLLSAFINKEASKIEILSGNSYATINLQSKEVQHSCMQEELNKYNLVEIKSGRQLSFSPIHIFSAVLYFGDGKHIWDGVCAVNRKTHKIDWIFTDKKMALGTNNPKIAGNKLYQLSLNNEL